MSERVVVVGAGIVGVCCALSLQREGLAVTMVSRDPPGEACSFGNAGGVGAAMSVAPLAMPGIARTILKNLRDPNHPLSVRASYLPFLLPWFLGFLAASRPDSN